MRRPNVTVRWRPILVCFQEKGRICCLQVVLSRQTMQWLARYHRWSSRFECGAETSSAHWSSVSPFRQHWDNNCFKVFVEMTLQAIVFWIVTSCSLVGGYRRFGRACCHQLQVFTLTLHPWKLIQQVPGKKMIWLQDYTVSQLGIPPSEL
jgi:hypothetical protein